MSATPTGTTTWTLTRPAARSHGLASERMHSSRPASPRPAAGPLAARRTAAAIKHIAKPCRLPLRCAADCGRHQARLWQLWHGCLRLALVQHSGTPWAVCSTVTRDRQLSHARQPMDHDKAMACVPVRVTPHSVQLVGWRAHSE
eukprot:359346-Chlamydomonas_euryale.AAC.3